MREGELQVYAVIMAGGGGRRLWPLSTAQLPKQFIDFGGTSLLQRTFQRISPLVSADKTLVVTGADMGSLVREQLPSLPSSNVIEEPARKNTAPCIGLGGILSREVLDLPPSRSVMVVSPSDHLITRGEKFRQKLRSAVQLAGRGKYMVTLGIKPDRPATGYGYIRAGEELDHDGARKAVNFTEKPDLEKARTFMRAGCYFWNSGTFIWRTDLLFEKFKTYLPEIFSGLQEIGRAWGGEDQDGVLRERYRGFSSISVDYGLMEKVDDRAVFPSSFGWSDVGDWASVSPLLGEDESGNVVEGRAVADEVCNSVIYNSEDKPVVGLGLEDLIVVNAESGVLVIPKSRVQDLKPIVKEIQEEGDNG
ncbi:MAG: mannose-1-phosphate guanylyltransferase [Candidatus Bipolaricaulota bacterium]